MSTSDWTPWDSNHLEQIETADADSWNRWRESNPDVKPRLWTANLERKNLAGWNLADADLRLTRLTEADLRGANLKNAMLRGASLRDADLRDADLHRADLGPAQMDQGDGGIYYIDTTLSGAKLAGCRLAYADLHEADLSYCQLVNVDLSYANLNGAIVYGSAAWDMDLSNTRQQDLRITRADQPYLAVDRLELAQFIYLLIENVKLRDVLDTLTLKTVLILGRFTKERMKFLNLIRDAVRHARKIPLVFDFDKPASKDLTGTIEVLARLASYVVVDLSDPRSVPHELATVVPFLRTTPIVPLLDTRSSTYGMFPDIARYPWVLETRQYESEVDLKNILPGILESAAQQATRLRGGH